MRKKEKAQDELDGLLVGLKKAQKERDFHFRPKDVDDVKWSGDSRLRCRDNSVENLKTMFAEKAASGELNLTNSLPKNFIHHHSNYMEKLANQEKTRDLDAFSAYPSSTPSSYLNSRRSRSSLSNDP